MDINIDHSNAQYDPFPDSVGPYIGALLLEAFLYGLYTTLFSICVYSLLRQRRNLHWILPIFAVAMYSIATADMLYTVVLCFRKLLKGTLSYQDLRLKYWLHVTNNILADSLLLYRCYLIWNHRKRIVIGPALLLLASSVVGYMFEGSNSSTLLSKSWVYLVLTLILNIILNVLTAGRIWWISRAAKNILDPGVLQRYTSVVNTIIESGTVYSLYMIIDIILHRSRNGSIVIDAGLVQVVGIMPTLIIVQISIGQTVHNVGAERRMSSMGTKPFPTNTSYPIAIKVDSSFQTSRSSNASLMRRDESYLSSDPQPPSKGTFLAARFGDAVDRVAAHTHVAEKGGTVQQIQPDLEPGRDTNAVS